MIDIKFKSKTDLIIFYHIHLYNVIYTFVISYFIFMKYYLTIQNSGKYNCSVSDFTEWMKNQCLATSHILITGLYYYFIQMVERFLAHMLL